MFPFFFKWLNGFFATFQLQEQRPIWLWKQHILQDNLPSTCYFTSNLTSPTAHQFFLPVKLFYNQRQWNILQVNARKAVWCSMFMTNVNVLIHCSWMPHVKQIIKISHFVPFWEVIQAESVQVMLHPILEKTTAWIAIASRNVTLWNMRLVFKLASENYKSSKTSSK